MNKKKNEGCRACPCMPQRLNLNYVKVMGERFRDEGQGKGCEEGTMQARRAPQFKPVKRKRPTKPNIMTFQDYKTQLEH